MLWGVFTVPGSAWMIVFFLVPFYAVAAVAFGRIDPIFGTAIAGVEPAAVGLHGGVEHARRGLQRAAPRRCTCARSSTSASPSPCAS